MADDDLAALERAEREAWNAYRGNHARALRDAWLTAANNVHRARRARIRLARRDG